MKAVNVDEVLKILWKYGEFIFATDGKRYSDMVNEIANLKALEQETCEDAVSRKELLKIYEDRFIELQKMKHLKDNKGAKDRQLGVNYCINILKELPPVTPLPKGCDIQRIIPKRVDVQKWIYTKCPNPNCNRELSTHHGDEYYSIEYKPDFCPNCGQALLWEREDRE